MNITLEQLGLNQEELTERLIEALCDRLLTSVYLDEDGDEMHSPSGLRRKFQTEVQRRVDEAVGAVAEKHILPRVTEMVETLVIQETNNWGEKVGKPTTFIEYLIARADSYLKEEVNHRGETRAQSRDSYWSSSGTRITSLVNKHLHTHIELAMTEAVSEANKSITGGIQAAVEQALKSISVKLKGVEVKRS